MGVSAVGPGGVGVGVYVGVGAVLGLRPEDLLRPRPLLEGVGLGVGYPPPAVNPAVLVPVPPPEVADVAAFGGVEPGDYLGVADVAVQQGLRELFKPESVGGHGAEDLVSAALLVLVDELVPLRGEGARVFEYRPGGVEDYVVVGGASELHGSHRWLTPAHTVLGLGIRHDLCLPRHHEVGLFAGAPAHLRVPLVHCARVGGVVESEQSVVLEDGGHAGDPVFPRMLRPDQGLRVDAGAVGGYAHAVRHLPAAVASAAPHDAVAGLDDVPVNEDVLAAP